MRNATFDGTVRYLPTADCDTHARPRALVTDRPNDNMIFKSNAARHVDEAVSAAKKLWRQFRVAHHTGADKGFRRLKAHKHLPALRAALTDHQAKHTMKNELEENQQAA